MANTKPSIGPEEKICVYLAMREWTKENIFGRSLTKRPSSVHADYQVSAYRLVLALSVESEGVQTARQRRFRFDRLVYLDGQCARCCASGKGSIGDHAEVS